MPTNNGKARILLKQGKATVKRRCPFTIQLTYETTNYTQPVVLCMDVGGKHIGLSAKTGKRELFAAQADLREDVMDNLSTRRGCRGSRRYRKARYRKPRFNNRKREKGWLAPSMRCKIQGHLYMVELVKSLLPIREISLEMAAFDIQKIRNPDIEGEDYQHGPQENFMNVRQYVLARDNHTCQACHGKTKDKKLHVHHVATRKTGGDRPDNLVTVCSTCHRKIHEGKTRCPVPKARPLRDMAAMNTMRKYLVLGIKERYPELQLHVTYGYLTKIRREAAGLTKSHVNDAVCSYGSTDIRLLGEKYYFKKNRRHNRQTHKINPSKGGVRKRNQAPYGIFGFRLFDKVLFGGKEYFIHSRRMRGYFDIRDIYGDKETKKETSYKNLKLIERRKGWLCTQQDRAIFDGKPVLFEACVLDTDSIPETDILSPEELWESHVVPDALENQEYWVTAPVTTDCFRFTVEKLHREPAIPLDTLALSDILDACVSLGIHVNTRCLGTNACTSAKSLFGAITEILPENQAKELEETILQDCSPYVTHKVTRLEIDIHA